MTGDQNWDSKQHWSSTKKRYDNDNLFFYPLNCTHEKVNKHIHFFWCFVFFRIFTCSCLSHELGGIFFFHLNKIGLMPFSKCIPMLQEVSVPKTTLFFIFAFTRGGAKRIFQTMVGWKKEETTI